MRKFEWILSGMLVFCLPSIGSAEEVNSAGKEDLLAAIVKPVSDDRQVEWAGRYIGFNLGYGFGEATQDYDRAGNHGLATLSPKGSLASVVAGYNMMFTPHVLLGVEGELGTMGVSQGTTTVFDGHEWSTAVGGFGTIRGRAGYVLDNALLYATGGLALAHIDDTSIGNTAPESAIEVGMRAGFVFGVGAEYPLNPGWTLKGEYLHFDFADVDGASANNEDYTFTNNIDTFRVGLNYKF
jgi:outer membrane immunogenic protein